MTPGIARVLLAGPLIGAAALVAPAAGQSADPANGRRLALKICTACHVVAPDQELPPSSRKPAPSFAAIARRPGITVASLQQGTLPPTSSVCGQQSRQQDTEGLFGAPMKKENATARWLSSQKALDPIGTAVAALLLLLSPADAASQRFDCTLTKAESYETGSNPSQIEHRSITLAVDEEAKTITVSQDSTTEVLGHVSFSQSTINGYTKDISVGMDRSSGSIVFQSYSANSRKIEFGSCSLR